MGFETCGPNEVMVLSGCCHGRSIFIPGGRVFVFPVFQTLQRIKLNVMTLVVPTHHVYTHYGVGLSVTGVAQVRIQGSNDEMLRAACELFLGKSEDEIKKVALETLEGHQRSILGNMTVEEIYQDRKKFSKAVFEEASSDLVNMGITVVSYVLKDIRDTEGYLKSLGQARTAQVKRDARIGEAEARKESGIKEALAEEKRMASRCANDIEIAKAERDFMLKKSVYDQEVQAKQASAEMAYQLQAAKTKQKIREEQMQIIVIERSQQIQVQEQEILRRERELEALIRKPADAEKYRIEKIAEANRLKIVMEAQAEAEAIQLRGEAEAFAIEAKAKAEAEQMAKKADAWSDYQHAAMIDMVLETIPKVAAEISGPLSNAKKITMVSSGKGEVGAMKLTNEVIGIMDKLPSVVENLTGINIQKCMNVTQRRI